MANTPESAEPSASGGVPASPPSSNPVGASAATAGPANRGARPAPLAYVDAGRSVAILMVVMIHACATMPVAVPVGSLTWWGTNVADAVSHAAVPLFLMLSGATLLGWDEPLGVFMRKRSARILVPFLAWSIAYYLAAHGSASTVRGFFDDLLSDKIIFHFWYFYALIPLYLLTPLLRRAVTHIPVGYLVAFAVASAALVDARALLGHVGMTLALDTSGFSTPLGYFLLGYVIAQRGWRFDWRLPLILSLGAMIAATYVLSRHGGGLDTAAFGPYGLLPMVYSASAFQALSAVSRPGGRVLSSLSGSSFGIYLVHPFVLTPLAVRVLDWTDGTPKAFLTLVGVWLASVAASWAATEVLRAIPVLRRLVS